MLRSCILILPSKTELLDRACQQLLEAVEGCRLIRKQIQLGLLVFRNLDRAIVNPIINPVRGNVKRLGHLGKRERPSHMTRMRLTAYQELPMLQAQPPDGAWQDKWMHR